jgi:hypothetical protein
LKSTNTGMLGANAGSIRGNRADPTPQHRAHPWLGFAWPPAALKPGRLHQIVMARLREWITRTARLSFNASYDSLAAALILLVWLWLTNVALLFAAEANAEIGRTQEVAERARSPTRSTPTGTLIRALGGGP